LVIDGRRLLEVIERAARREFDLASPLGWMPPEYLQAYVARLTGVGSPRLGSRRCELLVCPECGDLGCGCLSCRVARDGEYVVWSELGWEAGHEPTGPSMFPMGGFRFPAAELASCLEAH
jgi:hypothetical protein